MNWGSRDRTRQASCLIEEELKALKESSWRLQVGEQTVEVKSQTGKMSKPCYGRNLFCPRATSADPHAALAWAGFSLLSPLLLSPTSQNNALIDSLADISTLITLFTVTKGHFRHYKSALFTSCGSSGMADLALSLNLKSQSYTRKSWLIKLETYASFAKCSI